MAPRLRWRSPKSSTAKSTKTSQSAQSLVLARPDPRDVLDLMRQTRGRIEGHASFRRGGSASATWWKSYCFVNTELGSLHYALLGSQEGFRILVEDLRNHEIWAALDPANDQSIICIGKSTSPEASLCLKPLDPEQFNGWFAALLCWSPLSPGQKIGTKSKKSSKPLRLIKCESLGRISQPPTDVSKIIAAQDYAIFAENPASDEHKGRVNAKNVLLDVVCTLYTDGELLIRLPGEAETLIAVKLHRIKRSSIQRMSNSVTGRLRATQIWPGESLGATDCSRIRPIGLGFHSNQAYQKWFSLLRACSLPELYGLHNGHKLPEKPYAAFTNAGVAALRLEHTLNITLRRLQVNSVDRQSGNGNGTANSGHDSVESRPQKHVSYYVTIEVNDRVREISSTQRDINGVVVWLQNFVLADLPRTASLVAIKLYRVDPTSNFEVRDAAGLETKICGTVEIDLSNLEDKPLQAYNHSFKHADSSDFGQLTFDIEYKFERILPETHYESMSAILHKFSNNSTIIMSRLMSLDKLANFAKYLLDVFQHNGSVLMWMKHLIEQEVNGKSDCFDDNTNKSESDGADPSENSSINTNRSLAFTLFRGTSLLTKVLDLYMKRFGQTYLEETLGPIIREIAQNDTDCEIDLSKVSAEDNVISNKVRLTQITRQLWLRIFDSASRCPTELRLIFQHIRRCARSKFGDDMKFVVYTSVSGFLFLRFFCAAIFNPCTFNLIDELPGKHAQRTFLLAAKALQGLANLKTDFSFKEPWMAPMNQFCSDYAAQFETFIDSICNVPNEVALNSTTWISEECESLNSIRNQLPPLAQEGCLLVPGLVDPTRSFAALVDLWLDGRKMPNFEMDDSEESEILEDFDSACQKIRNTARFYASHIGHRDDNMASLDRRWALVTEDMELNPTRYWRQATIEGLEEEKDHGDRASPAPVVRTCPLHERYGTAPPPASIKAKRSSPILDEGIALYRAMSSPKQKRMSSPRSSEESSGSECKNKGRNSPKRTVSNFTLWKQNLLSS